MLTFLDFDGVIVDSISECYLVSFETYFGYARFSYDNKEYKKLFYQYRGLVKPAWQYMSLHRAIEEYFIGAPDSIDVLFHRSVRHISKAEAEAFEKKFFFTRSLYQDVDFTAWIEMNPLTEFGKTLEGKANENVYIVTTKNREATEAILNHYQIPVAGIYANEEIKSAGNKGVLIRSVLDSKAESEAIFVDDAVEHLDTVNDQRIKCYFASWGYGDNSTYKEYQF
jgi:phosphoglycolate phosphatase-like HAD superfamily hydrolase